MRLNISFPAQKILPFILILCLFPAIIFADTIHDYQTISDIINSVSIENIMKTISDLQENRDIDSPNKAYKSRYCLRVRETDNPSDGACDNAGDYIFKRLSDYGLQVEFATFDHVITDKSSGKQNHYKMKNVVSTLLGKGSHSDKIFIICAHYDSIASLSAEWMWNWGILPAPGADDNASGTSALMEIARILSQYEFDFTVKFIAFSGEELGMFGSKDYAKKAFSLNQQIVGVINLDMIGYDPNELDIDIIADQDSEWLANAFEHNRKEFGIDLNTNKIINPKMIYSDHSSFWKLGYSAILVNEGVNAKSERASEVNHTTDDTIDRLTPDLILKTSKLAISTLARLADPIGETGNEINADLAIDIDPYDRSIISKPESPITLEARIKNLGDEEADNVTTQ
ncbi:MAG: M28 family metallopeptidase, partial [Candidatus Poribacteria bacterium]